MKKEFLNKQISVGRLKEILKDIDDEYVVQLGIHEEGDLLTHVFTDNDSGVVELTNYVDEDENPNGNIVIGVDVFGNDLHVGDKVLVISSEADVLLKGYIEKVRMGIVICDNLYVKCGYSKDIKYKNVVRYEW